MNKLRNKRKRNKPQLLDKVANKGNGEVEAEFKFDEDQKNLKYHNEAIVV